jgi:hypothetical protein
MSVIPLYTSKGEAEAFLDYPHLFNRSGEWIGWVLPDRDVYSVLGYYVGYLTDDRRILRKRMNFERKPRLEVPPPPPHRISLPASVPLAPLMREINTTETDVLLEEPDRLHTLDVGELREDMD